MNIEEVIKVYEYIIDLKIQDFIDENPFMESHRDDLKQEAVEMLVNKLPDYDKSKSALSTYIRNNTLYACYKYRSSLSEQIIATPDLSQFFHEDKTITINDILIEIGLDKEDRDVIILLYEGYTQTQVAEELGIYQQKVSRIYRDFRKTLLRNIARSGTVYPE